jgi:hypothetical protein
MEQYKITLTGLTPLLMHNDNLAFTERVMEWRRAPENKELSTSGDDRSPAWTWIGYLYHDSKNVGIAADNIMTMLREGGAKVSTGKGKTTYKKQTQSGIMLDQQQFALYVNGSEIPLNPIRNLIGVTDFTKHLDVSEKLGFELMVKRARVGRTKHIRVRPMFREWVAVGSLTVLDSELTGLTQPIMQLVLDQAGALSGLCDWRPSSLASGIFGKFKPGVERLG